MEPKNVLMGDFPGTDLPAMVPDANLLVEEKKMAKYSRSTEFKKIKTFCEERIAFYQQYLPNGLEVGLEVAPTAEDWRVANRVIGELSLLMNMYETAAEVVKESNGQ